MFVLGKKGLNAMILASTLRNQKKKQKQIKIILIRRREIIKLRMETNEIKNRKPQKKYIKTPNWFLEYQSDKSGLNDQIKKREDTYYQHQ